MIVLEGFKGKDHNPAACRGGFLAIGNFDGVHRGHQRMLSILAEQAKTHHAPAVVLTFDPPPVELLRPEAVPPRLTTIEHKAKLIAQHGIDCLIVYPTDLALLNLSPEEFFAQIVRDQLDARGLVEGPNFYFGRDRRGNVELLKRFCAESGRSLAIVEPELTDGELISSSRIRALIADGQLARAVEMLGHAYQLEGRVVAGDGRGRALGFPTANLSEIKTLLPADGVYAGFAILDQERQPAAIHVGSNPTFGESARKVEVHVPSQTRDLYGQRLMVQLINRVRGTKTFGSAEELKHQIQIDLAEVLTLANLYQGG